MGKKGKVRGANATCHACGKWGDLACEYCKRLLCEGCARVWPLDGEEGAHQGKIITCPSSRCQSKLSPEARRQAAAALVAKEPKKSDDPDFEDWA